MKAFLMLKINIENLFPHRVNNLKFNLLILITFHFFEKVQDVYRSFKSLELKFFIIFTSSFTIEPKFKEPHVFKET